MKCVYCGEEPIGMVMAQGIGPVCFESVPCKLKMHNELTTLRKKLQEAEERAEQAEQALNQTKEKS